MGLGMDRTGGHVNEVRLLKNDSVWPTNPAAETRGTMPAGSAPENLCFEIAFLCIISAAPSTSIQWVPGLAKIGDTPEVYRYRSALAGC